MRPHAGENKLEFPGAAVRPDHLRSHRVLRRRGQAQQSDLAFVLSGLAQRTQQYDDRFISIICTETVHKQDFRTNLMPVGRPRTTVYELSVSRDSSGKDGERFAWSGRFNR